MPLSDFKLLSFGCYGTLIDRDSGVYTALHPLLSAGNLGLTRPEALAKFSEYEAQQQRETPDMAYCDVLARVHRRLAREWGVIASDDDHAVFGRSPSRWPIYADAPAALQYLKRFFKLVVLSNADPQTFAASNRKLEGRFDAVFTAQEIGSCKPDPRIFEQMANRLAKQGLERRQLLHVAHSLARDQGPAAACGLAFAWIDREGQARGGGVASDSSGAPPWTFRFSNLVDMVKAHQQR
jgi:2-haloacid dehalogenase